VRVRVRALRSGGCVPPGLASEPRTPGDHHHGGPL